MTKNTCFNSKQILKKLEIRIKTMPAGIQLLLSQLLSPRALCAIWKAGCTTIIAAGLHALYGTPDMTKRSVIECRCYDKQVLNEGRTIDFHPSMVLTVLKLTQVKIKCVCFFFYFVRLMANPQQLKRGLVIYSMVDRDIFYQKNKINKLNTVNLYRFMNKFCFWFQIWSTICCFSPQYK